jgi:cobalt-zinc-cadmium efflux system membrane fusion protein
MNKHQITGTLMRKMNMKYLIVVSIGMVMAVASCSSNQDRPLSTEAAAPAPATEDYELSTKQFQSSGMKLGKLDTQAFHQVVPAKGMFDVPPKNQAAVSSYFGGTVTDVQLLPGERVRKGQALFILENPDYVQLQQDYLEAKGQLTYLKSDYERQKNLVQDQVTSEKNYLKAEADYTVTQVKVESLGKKLALMGIDPSTLSIDNLRTTLTIYSPISGYVTAVNITKGTFITPSQTAINIVDTDHLHVELNIFERDLSKVQIGQTIRFRIQDDGSQSYQASVHLINKRVDPDTRTIGIHGHLSDEQLSERFNPGMYIEADIYTTTESKAALPAAAIVELDGRTYVLVLQSAVDGRYSFVKKEVKTGASSHGYSEILNAQDFSDDTAFLINGAFNLITE